MNRRVQFYAIFKLINSNFWKTPLGPFFAFVFPIIFSAILGTMLGFDQLLGGIIAIPSMTIGLTILPTSLFEFKNSSLLKRIGVTPIKPWMFLFVFGLFYISIMFIATFFTIGISILIFMGNLNKGRLIDNFRAPVIGENNIYGNLDLYSQTLKQMLSYVNWGGLIWGLIMNILVASSIGLFISSIAKSTLAIQGVGVPILIISQFLSAQVLQIGMIKSVDALWYLSFISPFKYSTDLIIESWNGAVQLGNPVWTQIVNTEGVTTSWNGVQNIIYTGTSNIFDVNNNFYMFYKDSEPILIFDKTIKIINLIFPFIFFAGFSLATLKTFKWSLR